MSWTGYVLSALVLGCAASAQAQSIDRESYLRHLPPMTRLVAHTEASARLTLYGDPTDIAFRDESPLDGVDDARAQHLLRIAHRFAPILRRNNFSAPRFFSDVFGGRPLLQLDVWRGSQRIRSDSVLLYDPGADGTNGNGHDNARAELERSDSMLAELVEQQLRDGRSMPIMPAEGEEETVLFFDFPGEDAASWRKAYKEARDHGVYAHFFIHEEPNVEEEARFSLVVQYWFFYPFNDSANNHEGDWEHLVVLLTTAERVATSESVPLLSENDLVRILDHASGAADSLVIREVEYYFHESVLVVDYLSVPAHAHSRWAELKHLHVWQQPDYIANIVRERRTVLNGRLATHPIGYIGGNNKGPDELANLWPRFQGSYNRNGHGTYPFPGTWQGVGALGATEQIAGRAVPRLRRDAELQHDSVPLEQLFQDEHFISFEPTEIQLLPDWERMAGLVREDPDARRAWSWLLLPIRWGYPASISPGAGAVAHVDLGQVAPEGPAFQPTWNRLASDGGFRVYRPHVMRALFVPMTPWDQLSSGWGFLNIPKTLLGFIPGWSVAFAQLGPWLTQPLELVGAAPNKTFAPDRKARRLTSTGVGWHRQLAGDAFVRLLPQPGHASLSSHSGIAEADGIDASSMARAHAEGARVWMNLHYGERFSVQNAFARSTSQLRYTPVDESSRALESIEGSLEMKELTAGFRYRFGRFGNVAELFAGAGWGWTWYRVDDVHSAGARVDFERKGGYAVSLLPSARWWPNTWYAVTGVELLAPRHRWIANRWGYGVQVEYTGLLHRLGATRPGKDGFLGVVTRREIAVGTVISW